MVENDRFKSVDIWYIHKRKYLLENRKASLSEILKFKENSLSKTRTSILLPEVKKKKVLKKLYENDSYRWLSDNLRVKMIFVDFRFSYIRKRNLSLKIK